MSRLRPPPDSLRIGQQRRRHARATCTANWHPSDLAQSYNMLIAMINQQLSIAIALGSALAALRATKASECPGEFAGSSEQSEILPLALCMQEAYA